MSIASNSIILHESYKYLARDKKDRKEQGVCLVYSPEQFVFRVRGITIYLCVRDNSSDTCTSSNGYMCTLVPGCFNNCVSNKG